MQASWDSGHPSLSERLSAIEWGRVSAQLDAEGAAVLPPVLLPEECIQLTSIYADDTRFRSRIEMARYGFGEGDYKYFANPLPSLVQELRQSFYPHLAQTANRWAGYLNAPERFPMALDEFLAFCHAHGQIRPTPLLLHYQEGGYNCLHQDLYGAIAFPLQVVFMLSRRNGEYEGGELLLVEQRPRAQSRGRAIALDQGAGLIFTTRYHPIRGSRGYYRGTMRHGVSPVLSGERYTLGIIFHDAS